MHRCPGSASDPLWDSYRRCFLHRCPSTSDPLWDSQTLFSTRYTSNGGSKTLQEISSPLSETLHTCCAYKLCACVKLFLTMEMEFPVTTHTLSIPGHCLGGRVVVQFLNVSELHCNTSSSGVHNVTLHQ